MFPWGHSLTHLIGHLLSPAVHTSQASMSSVEMMSLVPWSTSQQAGLGWAGLGRLLDMVLRMSGHRLGDLGS